MTLLKAAGTVFVALLATATHAQAQAPAATPDGALPPKRSAPSTAPASGFTIDQKGAKRTTGDTASSFTIDQKGAKRTTGGTASSFTIDQKGAKRTGDPLPDVDVSLDRKNQRVKGPVTGASSPSAESAGKPVPKTAAPK